METQARPSRLTIEQQTVECKELYAEREAYGVGFPANGRPFPIADDPRLEGELRKVIYQLSHG